MIIKEDAYLKHWGIKGMKWDNDKKKNGPTDAVEASKHGLTPFESKEKGKGYKDKNGTFYPGDLKQAVRYKTSKEMSRRPYVEVTQAQAKKDMDARKKTERNRSRINMSNTVKNITSDAIKKGKAFIDNLFSRG